MGTSKYGVDFFSDDFLEQQVATLLERVGKSAKTNLFKNVVDPYAILFEAAVSGTKISQWRALEQARQTNKMLPNAIGDFHQELLGNLPGWSSTGKVGGGLDLIHAQPFGTRQTPCFAEVKNKYNTMNSDGILAVFSKFQKFLSMPDYKQYTCYLVQVIQKKAQNDVPWKIAQRGEQDNIRIISAPYVYQLSTGDPQAFPKTLRAVVQILQDQHGVAYDGDDSREIEEILSNTPGFLD